MFKAVYVNKDVEENVMMVSKSCQSSEDNFHEVWNLDIVNVRKFLGTISLFHSIAP